MSLLSGKNTLDNLEFYLTRDSLAYFIETAGGEYFKLVFTGYNVSTGRIYFYKEALSATGVVETDNYPSLQAYPNPASSTLLVTFVELPHSLIPIIRFAARYLLNEIYSHQAGRIFCFRDKLIGITAQGRDDAFLRSMIAQVANQGARVDASYADDAVRFHVFM